jgi:predicted  nucleic acid-binding Zn-ribbon protein
MPPPSTGPQKPVTAQQVEEWLQAVNRKCLELSLHAMEPLYNTRRELAVMEMSHLLQEAIEEVRVVSASLREQSQAIRDHSSAVRAYSQYLEKQSKRHQEKQGIAEFAERAKSLEDRVSQFKMQLRKALSECQQVQERQEADRQKDAAASRPETFKDSA